MDFRQKIDITYPLHPSLKLFMMKIRITTVHLKFGCISEISGAVSMDGRRRLGARVSGDPDSAARLSVRETARYHTPSVDQPLAAESEAPLLDLFRAKHADFRLYICLRDYVQRLPGDEKWLAGTLSSGYTLEEIPVFFRCKKEKLTQIHNRLQRSMMKYLEI